MSSSFGRRGFLGLAGLAVGATALTACGNGEKTTTGSTPAASSSAPAADAGTITFWLDSDRLPVVKPIAEQFKNDTGVTVKLVVKDFQKLADDLVAQVPTGKGPDASLMPHDAVGRLVDSGIISPLELGDATAYQDVAIKAFTYKGKVYGVPYAVENIALVRNTALAPEAPKDFADMIATGTKVKASGKAKYAFLLGLDPKSSDPYHLYPFQTSFGAPVFESDDSGYLPKLAMKGDKGAAFAKWLAEQGKAGVLNMNVTGDIAKDQFSKGQAPYFVTGPWNLEVIQKAGIKYAIDPLPKAGTEDAQPFVGVQGAVMSAKTTNQVATQKFLAEYLGTEQVQTALFKTGHRAPANKAAFEAAKADADVKAFGEVGANGVPMPSLPAMAQVWTDWGQTQVSIISGKAADPAAAWEKMCTTIEGKIK